MVVFNSGFIGPESIPFSLVVYNIPAFTWCYIYFYFRGSLSDKRYRAKISDYCFSVENFKKFPLCAVTHMFFHISEEHLFNNCLAYVLGAYNFRKIIIFPYDEIDDFFTLLSLLDLVAIMLISGLGGVCALEFYHHTDALRTRKIFNFTINWVQPLIRKYYKAVYRNTSSLGASSCIYGLYGFNWTYSNNWFALLQIFLFTSEFWLLFSKECNQKSFFFEHDSESHIAHLGGFIGGAVLGFLFRNNWIKGFKLGRQGRRPRSAFPK